MKWIACELHTHTLHSDGRQTFRELAEGAVKLGFDAIALTDHNTMSGLVGKEEIEREYGLTIVPGMEWTTFYGHMVTVGLSEYADWRQATQEDIDQGIADVHRLGGLAGLAHPFRIGSPACTGCFWEYEIGDWNAVDYIEVWSGTFPSIQTDNHRAYRLWTDKLNEGYRIAATSGRDWHAQSDTDKPISVTYLQIEDATHAEDSGTEVQTDSQKGISESKQANFAHREVALIQALRAGRASVTIGPLLSMMLETGGKPYSIGSVLPAAQAIGFGDKKATAITAKLSVDFSVRPGQWSMVEQVFKLKLCSNLGEEVGVDVNRSAQRQSGADRIHPKFETSFELPSLQAGVSRKWLRAELWGTVQGAHTRIAFTNAVYFESIDEEGADQ